MDKVMMEIDEKRLSYLIKESVKRIINEIGDTERGQVMLKKLHDRHLDNALKSLSTHDAKIFNGHVDKAKDVEDYAKDKWNTGKEKTYKPKGEKHYVTDPVIDKKLEKAYKTGKVSKNSKDAAE